MLSHMPEAQGSLLSFTQEKSLVTEWSWLNCFATAMRTADSLTYRRSFPEGFLVPDEEKLDSEIACQPLVCITDRLCLNVGSLDSARG